MDGGQFFLNRLKDLDVRRPLRALDGEREHLPTVHHPQIALFGIKVAHFGDARQLDRPSATDRNVSITKVIGVARVTKDAKRLL